MGWGGWKKREEVSLRERERKREGRESVMSEECLKEKSRSRRGKERGAREGEREGS